MRNYARKRTAVSRIVNESNCKKSRQLGHTEKRREQALHKTLLKTINYRKYIGRFNFVKISDTMKKVFPVGRDRISRHMPALSTDLGHAIVQTLAVAMLAWSEVFKETQRLR